MELFNTKTFTKQLGNAQSFLLILVLLAGLGMAVWLTSQKTSLRSKASSEAVAVQESPSSRTDSGGQIFITKPQVNLVLTVPASLKNIAKLQISEQPDFTNSTDFKSIPSGGVVPYSLKSQTSGDHYIFVKFNSSNGDSETKSIKVTLVDSPRAVCKNNDLALYWPAKDDADHYAVRVDDLSTGWGGYNIMPGDKVNDNVKNSYFAAKGETGHAYKWWYHIVNKAGGLSDAYQGPQISCVSDDQNQLPKPTVNFPADQSYLLSATLRALDRVDSNTTVTCLDKFSRRNCNGKINGAVDFYVTAQDLHLKSDPKNGLKRVEVYVAYQDQRPFPQANCLLDAQGKLGKVVGPWCQIKSEAAAGGSYWATVRWLPQTAGDYIVVVNASDNAEENCSGNPFVTPKNWIRCSRAYNEDQVSLHIIDPTPRPDAYRLSGQIMVLTGHEDVSRSDSRIRSPQVRCSDTSNLKCHGRVGGLVELQSQALDFFPWDDHSDGELKKLGTWVAFEDKRNFPQSNCQLDSSGKLGVVNGPWCQLSSTDISGGSAFNISTWLPQLPGNYYIVVNAADKFNNNCSGNPFETPAGWIRCSRSNTDQIKMTVLAQGVVDI